MRLTLYGFGFSHPVQAARGMLDHKGLQYRFVDILPGMHPLVVRARGFPGATVPALDIDGEKVQGSRTISRRLEQLVPQPSLFPADRRAEVEAAEEWGETELQDTSRLAFRWALARRRDLRAGLARESGVPLPGVAAVLGTPQAAVIARISGATAERVRAEVARLPERLEHVDALVRDGLLGGDEPNAADFQIGASIRALLAFDDFRPLVEGRSSARLADRFPPQRASVPTFLPAGWLPERRAG